MPAIHSLRASRTCIFFQKELIRNSDDEASAGQGNPDVGNVEGLVDMKNNVFPIQA